MPLPVTLLHTFVVVARLASMKAAAQALNLTPGAISQRIRELEERWGQRLFARTQSGVEPTVAGADLFARLDAAFRTIEGAEPRQRGGRAVQRLVINTVPSFATTWLVPRLIGFQRLHPDIEVAVETDTRVIDLRREPVDISIRHGLGRYRGLTSVWLMSPQLVVLASPALLAGRPPLRTPQDCLAYPLLQDPGRRDWALWFEANGVAAERPGAGSAFADEHLLVRAAASGQGLALARDIYAREELADGRLVRLLDARWPTEFAYYAVGTSRSFARPTVKRFVAWLEQAARTDGGAEAA